MNIIIFGGTGFIGRSLTEVFLEKGYRVCVVTRNYRKTAKLGNDVHLIEWDNQKPLSLVGEQLRNVDVVVNLAGESIGNRRWSNSVKQEILASRIRTTRAIVTGIKERIFQPEVLINASATGYYGPRGDDEITEGGKPGQDFLAQVCREWEGEAGKAESKQTRVAMIRTSVVLGSEGALTRMVTPFKFFLGGPLGTGKQWLSWIHILDLVRLINFVIERRELSGPINATAPEPVRMKNFCNVLGGVLNRPSWFPVPEFALRAALGQMSEMLLNSQRVIPKKAIDAGFEFQYPNLRAALESILKKEPK